MTLDRPSRTDAALAAGLTLLVGVESIALLEPSIAAAETLLAVLVVLVPVAWRRVMPATAASWVAVALLAETAVFDALLLPGTLVILAVVVTVYSLAAYAARRSLVAGAAIVVLAYNGLVVAGGDDGVADAIFVDALVLTPSFAIGLIARRRRDLAGRLAGVASELEHEREGRADAAAGAERTRLAAELHGVIAGGVAAMLREADEAAARVRDGDGGAAARIAAIEAVGRDTLNELRQALGVLRREDEDLALAPQPTLARLDALVARVRRRGLRVGVRVDGEPLPVSTGLDIAAYRLVEEALDAAGSAGRAEVAVTWSARRLTLDVTTDDASLSGAATIAALRERAALFDGDLHAGRRRDGGSRVHVELPVVAVLA